MFCRIFIKLGLRCVGNGLRFRLSFGFCFVVKLRLKVFIWRFGRCWNFGMFLVKLVLLVVWFVILIVLLNVCR